MFSTDFLPISSAKPDIIPCLSFEHGHKFRISIFCLIQFCIYIFFTRITLSCSYLCTNCTLNDCSHGAIATVIFIPTKGQHGTQGKYSHDVIAPTTPSPTQPISCKK